jgi:aquaporin Z
MQSNCPKCIHKFLAEFIGTMFLIIVGCGSAIFAGTQIGWLGVALAFGLTLTVLIYSLGPISGGHFNPAVTLGLTLANKFSVKNSIPYIIFQCLGAILGGFILYHIAIGKAGFDINQGFALNGFGEHSPQEYSMISCLITEVIVTGLLVFVVLCSTKEWFITKFTGLVVGFSLAALHLVSIPITNASINFARSLGVAVIHGGWAIEQLWLFGIAHVIAVILAVVLHKITTCAD